jgi:hypothetical protein
VKKPKWLRWLSKQTPESKFGKLKMVRQQTDRTMKQQEAQKERAANS